MKQKFVDKIHNIYLPSKFSGGTSTSWRGNSVNYIQEYFKKFPQIKKNFCQKDISINNNKFFFNSARSAIAFVLNELCTNKNEKVIVSAFTCDALTFAITIAGKVPFFVDVNADLTMEENNIKEALKCNPAAIIIQNSFGRLGVSHSFIKKLQKNGIFVIIDNSLSVGSSINGKDLSDFGDVSVWTYECTKTFTLGGGGVLKINNKNILNLTKVKFENLCKVNPFEDLRKLLQMYLSIKIQEKGGISHLGPVIWYLCYFLGLFRSSSSQNKLSYKSVKKMGKYSLLFLMFCDKRIEKIYQVTMSNVNFLTKHLIKRRLDTPIISRQNEKIVSPRVVFFVKKCNIQKLLDLSYKHKIELGRWFTNVPPKLPNKTVTYYSLINAQSLSKVVFNLPAYWSLTKIELKNLINLIDEIGELESNDNIKSKVK